MANYPEGLERVSRLLDANPQIREYLHRTFLSKYLDKTLHEMRTRSILVGGGERLLFYFLAEERVDFRNIIDLENNKLRKTSFTTMANGANVYRYSYVVPLQIDASVTVRF